MLQNTKELNGYKLTASDGDIGHVKDFYFDDKNWVIRYLVADTGSWMTGHLVLLSPHAFGGLDENGKTLQVNLTRKQIENSPSIESHEPVSRQYEIDYYRYYGWPAYWEGSALWGFGAFPAIQLPSGKEMAARVHHRADKHLQSIQAVTGYCIQTADDGVIGHVSGFQVDAESWSIRELIVETGRWFFDKEILISPGMIERISYEESKVFVNLNKADIQRTAEHNVAKACR